MARDIGSKERTLFVAQTTESVCFFVAAHILDGQCMRVKFLAKLRGMPTGLCSEQRHLYSSFLIILITFSSSTSM